MIDRKLYRETFSRLRASDQAKQEVLQKMQERTMSSFLRSMPIRTTVTGPVSSILIGLSLMRK